MLHHVEAALVGRLVGRRTTWAVRWLRAPNPSLSVAVLRGLGASVGEGVTVKNTLLLDNAYEDAASTGDFSHLHIGDNVYIGDSVYFDLAAEVRIGEDAMVSAGARLVTHADMNRSPLLGERFPRVCAPVTVGSGAHVGVNAVLLAGATVAPESILASGAVLPQHATTLPRTVWGGVPARQIGTIEDRE